MTQLELDFVRRVDHVAHHPNPFAYPGRWDETLGKFTRVEVIRSPLLCEVKRKRERRARRKRS